MYNFISATQSSSVVTKYGCWSYPERYSGAGVMYFSATVFDASLVFALSPLFTSVPWPYVVWEPNLQTATGAPQIQLSAGVSALTIHINVSSQHWLRQGLALCGLSDRLCDGDTLGQGRDQMRMEAGQGGTNPPKWQILAETPSCALTVFPHASCIQTGSCQGRQCPNMWS